MLSSADVPNASSSDGDTDSPFVSQRRIASIVGYSISSQEAFNIGLSNFFTMAGIAFSEWQRIQHHGDTSKDAMDLSANEDKEFGLAAGLFCSTALAFGYCFYLHRHHIKQLEKIKKLRQGCRIVFMDVPPTEEQLDNPPPLDASFICFKEKNKTKLYYYDKIKKQYIKSDVAPAKAEYLSQLERQTGEPIGDGHVKDKILLPSELDTLLSIAGHAIEKEYYDEIKSRLNPWYRRFKAMVFLGNAVGLAIGEIIFAIPGLSYLPPFLKLPIKNGLSAGLGLLFGLISILIPAGPDMRNTGNNESIFHLGRDGWARYAKAGIQLGSIIGGLIGIFIPVPGGMVAGAALGSAIGGVLGFGIGLVAVPLINLIFHRKKTPTDPNEKKANISDNKYRTKYLRTGTAVGVCIGTIIGTILGLCFPLGLPFFVPLCVGIAGVVCAIAFAIVGPRITDRINAYKQKDYCYSSFDFGGGTGLGLGQNGLGFLSNGLIDLLNFFGIAKELTAFKNVFLHGLAVIGAVIGALFDGITGVKNRKYYEEKIETEINALPEVERTPEKRKDIEDKWYREFEKTKSIVPWSQRVGTFGTLGGFAGGALGFLIGFLVGGPFGAGIGLAIGIGAGTIIAATTGALCGNWIYKRFNGFCEKISGNKQPSSSGSPTDSPTGSPLVRNTSEVYEDTPHTRVPTEATLPAWGSNKDLKESRLSQSKSGLHHPKNDSITALAQSLDDVPEQDYGCCCIL